MRTNDGAIDAVLLPIDLAISIGLLLQRFQHALPYSGFDPPIKSTGYRSPRTIPLREVSPRRSRSDNPQNPIENQTMILCWTTNDWLLRRQQGIQL
jgi:hypothetical protein